MITTRNGKQYAVLTIRPDDPARGTLEPGAHWVEMPMTYDPADVRGVDVLHDGALRALRDWEAEDLDLPLPTTGTTDDR